MTDRIRRYRSRLLVAGLATCAVAAGIPLSGLAQGSGSAKPLELRRIMRELDGNMQLLVHAISREDWALVAQTAPKIANHREPPTEEKMRILSFLGADAPKFKGADEATHKAAGTMAQKAQQGDGNGVVAAFAEVQRGCLSCHQSFRKPFLARFYGQQ